MRKRFVKVFVFWRFRRLAPSFKQMLAMSAAMVVLVAVSYVMAVKLGLTKPDWLVGIIGLVVSIAAPVLQFPISGMFGLFEKRHLKSFPQVFEAAVGMLEEVKGSDDLEFYMVAASPAFGLELTNEERRTWDDLFNTCVVTGKGIHLLCLSPIKDGAAQSPLEKFCSALAAHPDNTDNSQDAVKEYLAKALTQMRKYHEMSTWDQRFRFEIKVGSEPPFQIILTRNIKTLETRAIVYFSSTKSLNYQQPMTGFETLDEVTNDILYYLYSHFSNTYATIAIQQIPVPQP